MDKLPNRQSIRKKGWDYSAPGWYFVTCNTHGGKALFGTIVNGRMILNAAGKIAEEEWRRSAELRKEIRLDEFVVMPNHFHGLVRIAEAGDTGDLPRDTGDLPVARTLMPKSLGALIAGFKGGAGKRINLWRKEPGAVVWHRNYWDVIVRDAKALANIRSYIRENPRNYERVFQCGTPRLLGNPELLKLPKVGFLASRGGAGEHGALALKKGEAIISGFLSPMERNVFRAALRAGRPLIWIKPWGLEVGLTDAHRQAIDANRLLVVSPFDDAVDAPSLKRAGWCNEYVISACDRLVIGYLNPSGLLACLLSEARPDLEIASAVAGDQSRRPATDQSPAEGVEMK